MTYYNFKFNTTPRPCKLCGEMFKPNSARQVYCCDCKSVAQRLSSIRSVARQKKRNKKVTTVTRMGHRELQQTV